MDMNMMMDVEAVGSGSSGRGLKLKQMGHEEKKTTVHDEIRRVNRLPPNSSYASHRLRVLNKILQLLSVERTTSQDEELELLFAGLHL